MYGTYLRLGLHVSDSDIAVIRAARRKLKPKARRDREVRQMRHDFYRMMIRHHKESRDLFYDVMRGDLSGE